MSSTKKGVRVSRFLVKCVECRKWFWRRQEQEDDEIGWCIAGVAATKLKSIARKNMDHKLAKELRIKLS